jgi:hypothetical protein
VGPLFSWPFSDGPGRDCKWRPDCQLIEPGSPPLIRHKPNGPHRGAVTRGNQVRTSLNRVENGKTLPCTGSGITFAAPSADFPAKAEMSSGGERSKESRCECLLPEGSSEGTNCTHRGVVFFRKTCGRSTSRRARSRATSASALRCCAVHKGGFAASPADSQSLFVGASPCTLPGPHRTIRS